MLAQTPGSKAPDPIAKIKGLIRRRTSEKLRLEKDIAVRPATAEEFRRAKGLIR